MNYLKSDKNAEFSRLHGNRVTVNAVALINIDVVNFPI